MTHNISNDERVVNSFERQVLNAFHSQAALQAK